MLDLLWFSKPHASKYVIKLLLGLETLNRKMFRIARKTNLVTAVIVSHVVPLLTEKKGSLTIGRIIINDH